MANIKGVISDCKFESFGSGVNVKGFTDAELTIKRSRVRSETGKALNIEGSESDVQILIRAIPELKDFPSDLVEKMIAAVRDATPENREATVRETTAGRFLTIDRSIAVSQLLAAMAQIGIGLPKA